ncbi:hypothetical protein L0128_14045 [candidate division KSB1 bacterium]|nr:hypothetical protein [candidate division KSB1 bacterium]
MAVREGDATKTPNGSIEQIREIIFGDLIVRFEGLFNELKMECQRLEQRIAALEQQGANLDQSLNHNLDHSQTLAADQQKIRASIESLEKDLRQQLARIEENKVDKTQIGQAFIDWGMKVKQTGK